MQRQNIIKIFIASAVIGAFVGVISFLFIRAIQIASGLLWGLVPNARSTPWVVIALSLVGGALMGLCLKYFGSNDEGIGFESVLSAVKADGELGVKQLKRVVLNTYAGLVTGASIGPESPLVTLGGFVGDAVAKLLKVSKDQVMALISIALGGSMGVLVDSPVAGPILFAEQPPAKDPAANRLLVFTSMVAASIGFGLYYLLGAPLLKGTQLVPAYDTFRFIDLFYALILGVVGTIIGLVLKGLILHVRKLARGLTPMKRGLLTGLIVGLLGSLSPLVLFDGSAELSHLVTNISHYSVMMLLFLALVRLISTSVALGGGYQGGNIFPSIFICGAVGLAINGLFPFIPAPVAMVSCMAATMYTFMPMPLFSIFLFTEISSFSLIPAMAMALVSAYLVGLLRSPRKAP